MSFALLWACFQNSNQKSTNASRLSRSGGAPRATVPEEWAFLEDMHSTPSKGWRKKNVSPLSQLREDQWNVTTSPRQGRSSQAFLLDRDSSLSSTGENEELFVKKVLIMSPDNSNDKAYREHRILMSLRRLLERGQCFNFVTVVLSGLSQDDHLELVLERGGGTLHARQRMSVAEVRETLMQLLYALEVAQQELRFVHYDLHDKNVLIEDFEEGQGCSVATADGRVMYAHRVLVKLADFALSSIEVGGESVCNAKHAMGGAFDPRHDLAGFADCLTRIVIVDKEQEKEAMVLLRQLKHAMKSGKTASPGALLQHAFFDPLLTRPPDVELILTAIQTNRKNNDSSSTDKEGGGGTRASPRSKKTAGKRE